MVVVATLVLLIIGGVALTRQAALARSRGPHHGTPPSPGRAVGSTVALRPGLDSDLRRWVAGGLVSAEQAAAIEAWEASFEAPPVPARPRRIPAVAEALGYLGGVLAVTGLVLVVGRYWPDMATAGRLALSAAGALVPLVAGALVRPDGDLGDVALERLRGFLWLASAAAAAVFAGVLAADALGADSGETIALAVSAAVALHSGLLWRWRERPLQQLACLGSLAVVAGATVSEFSGSGSGLAVWAVGAGFLYAGLRRRTPLPLVTEGVGALAVVVGAFMSASDWPGPGLLFAVATAVGLLALATVPGLAPTRADQVEIGALGGLCLLQAVPGTLGYFAGDAGVITGLATWVAGGVLLAAGTLRLVRLPVVAEVLGAGALVGGAALTGVQSQGFAPLFGIVTAIALVAFGTLAGNLLPSAFGSLALLVNVPWAIGHYFPEQGQAPLLIMVSGALIIAVAVLLTRTGRPGSALPGRT